MGSYSHLIGQYGHDLFKQKTHFISELWWVALSKVLLYESTFLQLGDRGQTNLDKLKIGYQ